MFEAGHLVFARKKSGRRFLDKPAVHRLINKGASGVICADASDYPDLEAPVLEVKNLQQALYGLATDHRQSFGGQVIGVTGSAGKTTTAALLAHLLSRTACTSAPKNNSANTLVGVAWNMTNMSSDAGFWVVEMAIAQMAKSAKMVQPHVAVVTNIAPSHLVYHNNTETIATRKACIVNKMPPGGVLVLYGQIKHKSIFLDKARNKEVRVITYGSSEHDDIQLVSACGNQLQIEMPGD